MSDIENVLSDYRPVPELPAPRARPHRVRHHLDTRDTEALQVVLSRAHDARQALINAGNARLATYDAVGQDPNGPLSLSLFTSNDPRSEAAAIDTAVWAKRTGDSISGTQSSPSSRPGADEAARWENARAEMHQTHAAVETALKALPRPRHLPQRMTRIWWEFALDRVYYNYPGLDEPEHAAWTCLAALPERRCPGHAPRTFAAYHRDWARRQGDEHEDEIEHLIAISDELRKLQRTNKRKRK